MSLTPEATTLSLGLIEAPEDEYRPYEARSSEYLSIVRL